MSGLCYVCGYDLNGMSWKHMSCRQDLAEDGSHVQADGSAHRYVLGGLAMNTFRDM